MRIWKALFSGGAWIEAKARPMVGVSLLVRPDAFVVLERDLGGFLPGARDILQGGYE